MSEPLVIDVVSDVVCPWCYVGKRRLEAPLRQEGDVRVRWRPFQLDPTIPEGGVDRKEYMRKKFGDGPRLGEAHARLATLGAEVGVNFDFESIKRSPNTLAAHRLIRFASEAGVGDAVVERLFADYFERGRDIGDRETLLAAARDCGLNPVATASRLDSGEGAMEVEEEIEQAQKMGVEGVPFFIFASKYALSGAQSEDVFQQVIAQVRAA